MKIETLSLDAKLIDDFRKEANSRVVLSEILKNSNGKNKWNIICSAMDWITVAVDGLPSIDLNVSIGFGYNHVETVNLMQYIITIDVLTESVIQLYRVLGAKNEYPLSSDTTVFRQENISDDTYFKHIRAVFSTHPVNLTSLDGVPNKTGERFYASWSARDGIEYDFIVFLYSNNPDQIESIPFGINISDVNKYAMKRYSLLTDLREKLIKIERDHEKLYRNITVPILDILSDQLELLVNENRKRFGDRYGFADELFYIRRMISVKLSTSDDFDYVDEYRSFLINRIEKIRLGLQALQLDNSWRLPSSGYEFEKIYTYLYDGKHPLGEKYYENLVICGVLPKYLLNIGEMDEKQLFLDALLHKESNKRGKPISYSDLTNM